MSDETRTVPRVDVGWGTGLQHGSTIVAVFALVGFGVGGSAYVGITWLAGLFDAGAAPTENAAVGIIFLHTVILPFALGALLAGATGFVAGRAVTDRLEAAMISGGGAFVGFYLLAGLAIFASLLVVITAGGGGGGEGPFTPADLVAPIVKSSVIIGIVGAGSGYLGARTTP